MVLPEISKTKLSFNDASRENKDDLCFLMTLPENAKTGLCLNGTSRESIKGGSVFQREYIWLIQQHNEKNSTKTSIIHYSI